MRGSLYSKEHGSVVVFIVVGVIAVALAGSFFVFMKRSSQKIPEPSFTATDENTGMNAAKVPPTSTGRKSTSQQPETQMTSTAIDSDVDLIDNKLKQLDADSNSVDSGLNDTPIPQEP